MSLRHYHFPTLSTWINSVKYVDARKTIFTRHCQKIRKIFASIGQARNVIHNYKLINFRFLSPPIAIARFWHFFGHKKVYQIVKIV